MEEHFGPASRTAPPGPRSPASGSIAKGSWRAGRAFKYRHMRVLKQDVALCSAAPHVLEDTSVALAQPPHVTVNLLQAAGQDGSPSGAAAPSWPRPSSRSAPSTTGDWEDRYALARAIGDVRPVLRRRAIRLVATGRPLGTAAAAASIGRSPRWLAPSTSDCKTPPASSIEADLDPIRESPAFQAEVERAKKRQAPLEVGCSRPLSDRAAGSSRFGPLGGLAPAVGAGGSPRRPARRPGARSARRVRGRPMPLTSASRRTGSPRRPVIPASSRRGVGRGC